MMHKEQDRSLRAFIRDIINYGSEDNISLLAAALSYYTFFSLAPLLLVAIAVAGLAFGRYAVEKNVIAQVTVLIGPDGAWAVRQLLHNVQEPAANKWAAALGAGTLLVGASSVFQQLQSALNVIWKVPPKKGGTLIQLMVDYLLSFGIVVSTGFLLLVSLLASAAIVAINGYLSPYLQGIGFIWRVIDLAVSWAIITVLFALIFKFLPNALIAWRDVWVGAAVTALLFTGGKYLIGLYLGHSTLSSVYGAAASLVIILLWIYYSSQILLFGAEFTKEYSRMYGSRRT